MKADLHFDLTGTEDAVEFMLALSARGQHTVLNEMREELRRLRKYADLEPGQKAIVEKIEAFFYTALQDEGVDIDAVP